jgi:hypothetical protein
MDFYTPNSQKYLLSLDGTYDELRFEGILESEGYFPSLSDNEEVNSLWKSFGCPSCEFSLSIFRAEDSEGNTPSIDANTIDCLLQLSKNGTSKGSGNIKIHPKHFDTLLHQLINKPKIYKFEVAGRGALISKKTDEAFECKIKINIIQIIFNLN